MRIFIKFKLYIIYSILQYLNIDIVCKKVCFNKSLKILIRFILEQLLYLHID